MTDTIHTVTVAIIAHLDCVLLLQRNPDEYPGHGDTWELIGGHIQVGEYIRDAAYREVGEETGIVGMSLQFVDLSTFEKDGQRGNNTSYVAFISDELSVTLSSEHQAYRWTPLDEALKMTLACKHGDILAQIVKQYALH